MIFYLLDGVYCHLAGSKQNNLLLIANNNLLLIANNDLLLIANNDLNNKSKR